MGTDTASSSPGDIAGVSHDMVGGEAADGAMYQYCRLYSERAGVSVMRNA